MFERGGFYGLITMIREEIGETGPLEIRFRMDDPRTGTEIFFSTENTKALTMMLVAALMDDSRAYTLLRGVISSFETTVLTSPSLANRPIGDSVRAIRADTEAVITKILDGELLEGIKDESPLGDKASEEKKPDPGSFTGITFSAS